MNPRISLIAAIDTDGKLYYALTQVNTNTDVMKLFMWHLVQRLEKEDSHFRENTVFQLDGAKYHTSPEMIEFLRLLNINVIYTGPRQYDGSAIEKLFAYLKYGDLNPSRMPVGKKK